MIGPLARAEIREVQTGLGVNETKQAGAPQRRTLHHHLSANENVDLSGIEPAANRVGLSWTRRAVAVQPLDAGARVQPADGIFHALGAGPGRLELRGMAVRADIGQLRGGAAIMTRKPAAVLVKRIRDVTARAGRRTAAVAALQRRREAFAVQIENN